MQYVSFIGFFSMHGIYDIYIYKPKAPVIFDAHSGSVHVLHREFTIPVKILASKANGFKICLMTCIADYSKIVSMVRKYHNHKLQTNPWHREEKPHNRKTN